MASSLNGGLAGLAGRSRPEIAASAAAHMVAFARRSSSSSDGASQPQAKDKSGLGIVSFLTAIAVAVAIFTIQFTLFTLLRNKLARIFKPKTYLVPERERTESPPRSLVGMIRTLILYPEREVIKKCGLDAYFFLRYLKTLLVIFAPVCLIVLPILVPINYVGGLGKKIDVSDQQRDSSGSGQPTGLDTLAWGNIAPEHASRYTAHLILAILVVIWFCYVFYLEMRVYIKVRQDYLTSAEHRLRASATTVLVNSIPEKWLNQDALFNLFDVFPGGVRNVWINRNFDPLLDKISLRDDIHRQLESAETDLVRGAKKAQLKQQNAEEKKRRRKLNLKALSRSEISARNAKRDAEANRLAHVEEGNDAGQGQDVPHTIDAAVRESELYDQDGNRVERSGDASKTAGNYLNPLHQVEAGMRGLTGAAGRAVGGVNNVMVKSHGFADLTSSQGAPARESPSPQPAESSKTTRISSNDGSMITSNSTNAINGANVTGLAMQKRARKADQSEGANAEESAKSWWQFWKPPSGGYASPVPQGIRPSEEKSAKKSWKQSLPFMGSKEQPVEYDDAYESEIKPEDETDAAWTKYVKQKNRPTHHLPLFGVKWLFGMPFVTKKVDTIYWCRQELARLNLEIEEDQKHPERFPLVSSAFVQFNHQVAAHMACQSVLHHLPKQMAPRMVEISPRDVEWGNMAVNWWQQWIRTSLVVAVIVIMVVLWTIPVGWTAALGQSASLINNTAFLQDVKSNETLRNLITAVAGVLPAALLGLLLILVPIIFGLLAGLRGEKTGSQKAEFVQKYYFAFLFVQVFLVVSIASFFFKSIQEFIDSFKNLGSVTDILDLLARNLPSAAIYFFTYMILQALSTSSGTLLQIGALFLWFVWAPISDSTARSKWTRNTSLNHINWGAVFPVYTNFACIAVVYCVIAPLISIFAIITFSLLWLAQRYAMLYVNRFERDTGGVLYPRAINQTFTGLYFMELCLAGLFFIVPGENDDHPCKPHGCIMLVMSLLTAYFQVQLNSAFSPLFRYLPITFENEAVLRDEAFQRAQDIRFGLLDSNDNGDDEKQDDDVSEGDDEEKQPYDVDHDKDLEMQLGADGSHHLFKPVKQVGQWVRVGGKQVGALAKGGGHQLRKLKELSDNSHAARYRRQRRMQDLEAQRAIGEALYGGIPEDIVDLTPDERNVLTQHAFLHAALRARRPTVWIPRDDLGISDDEIRRTRAFSKHIWISNEGTALDSKARVVYGKSPPDFSEVDIVNL